MVHFIYYFLDFEHIIFTEMTDIKKYRTHNGIQKRFYCKLI